MGWSWSLHIAQLLHGCVVDCKTSLGWHNRIADRHTLPPISSRSEFHVEYVDDLLVIGGGKLQVVVAGTRIVDTLNVVGLPVAMSLIMACRVCMRGRRIAVVMIVKL